jgi:hypothetical protein
MGAKGEIDQYVRPLMGGLCNYGVSQRQRNVPDGNLCRMYIEGRGREFGNVLATLLDEIHATCTAEPTWRSKGRSHRFQEYAYLRLGKTQAVLAEIAESLAVGAA